MTGIFVAMLLAAPPALAFEFDGATGAWAKFLDATFTHFDRDGDKVLSPTEAGRMFHLGDAPIDFAALDADKDGKATPAEWKAFAAHVGFRPVIVTVTPPDAEACRLADAMRTAIDGDPARIPRLMRAFDADDDEFLTPAELLATAPKAVVDEPKSTPTATLRFTDQGVSLADAASDVRLTSERGRFRVTGADWAAFGRSDGIESGRGATGFVRAQFRAAVGDGESIDLAAVESDPASALVRDVFTFADGDGDGKLTAAEMDAYLALVDLGFASRVTVTVTPRGRNLFDALDADGDGRLSVAELNGEARQGKIAESFAVVVRKGGFRSFGKVPAAAPTRNAVAKGGTKKLGPAWFVAMDRNGDGVVSAGEYLGPPAAFAGRDRNRDGVIDLGESGD